MSRLELVVSDEEYVPQHPLDFPKGRLLIQTEGRIRGHDLDSLKSRRYSGQIMLDLRGDRPRLPMGMRQAIIEQLKISSSEINYRMKLAEKYQLDDLSTLVDEYVTWDNIRRKALYEPRTPAPKPTGKNQVPLATSARNWSHTIKTRTATNPLTAADRKELAKLATLITSLLNQPASEVPGP